LKDAPILLLDEVTSNVDSLNEALIQRAITRLAAERTVLMIAHHLQTVKSADNILVFKQGRLVESGGHKELLARGGVYNGADKREKVDCYMSEGPPSQSRHTPPQGKRIPSQSKRAPHQGKRIPPQSGRAPPQNRRVLSQRARAPP
jgi:ABC-type multidrug transport system ATPase subunit